MAEVTQVERDHRSAFAPDMTAPGRDDHGSSWHIASFLGVAMSASLS